YGLGDAGHLVEVAHVVCEIGVVGDPFLVASKQRKIGDVEAHQRGKQTPIGLGNCPAEQVALARQSRFELVEGGEQRVVGGFVGGLRLREAAAVDAVVDVGVGHF